MVYQHRRPRKDGVGTGELFRGVVSLNHFASSDAVPLFEAVTHHQGLFDVRLKIQACVSTTCIHATRSDIFPFPIGREVLVLTSGNVATVN